jgi:Ran GTPase-activating protein (RanGAP) involved in mRNA processing and transport
LHLGANRLGPVAVKHLAQSPHLSNLRVLDLTSNPVGDKGALALAESPHLRNLVQLELMHCDIGDSGAEALLASPFAAGLIHLNVYGARKNRVSDAVKQKLKGRLPGGIFV